MHEEYEYGVRIRTLPDLIDFMNRNCQKPFRVLYSSPSLLDDPLESHSEFNRLCLFLNHVPDFIFCVDEVNLYTDCSSVPEHFGYMITQGRRHFIDVLAAVRRKQETNNLLTSQANIVVSFKQYLPDDVRFMASRMGELAEKIPNLQPLQFVYASDYERGEGVVNHEGRLIPFIEKLDMNGF